MNVIFQYGLPILAVVLAAARAGEQLMLASRQRCLRNGRTRNRRASVLAPIAGITALAYAHSVNGADIALQMAAWLNMASALVSWAGLPALTPSPDEALPIDSVEQAHE